jgi:hypothetical protein
MSPYNNHSERNSRAAAPAASHRDKALVVESAKLRIVAPIRKRGGEPEVGIGTVAGGAIGEENDRRIR